MSLYIACEASKVLTNSSFSGSRIYSYLSNAFFFNFIFFLFDVVVEESMHGNDCGGSTSNGKMEASLSRASFSGNYY
jgi:hypothetical protein